MFGWLTVAAARASRSRRSRAEASGWLRRRLDRDGTVELFIVRGVDDAHAAFTELPRHAEASVTFDHCGVRRPTVVDYTTAP